MSINRLENLYSSYSSDFDLSDHVRAWDLIINKIQRFRYLNDNWDGEGSLAPSVEMISSLIEYLSTIRDRCLSPSRVLADTDGGIIVEWQTEQETLELETSSPGYFDFMLVPDSGEPTFFHFDYSQQPGLDNLSVSAVSSHAVRSVGVSYYSQPIIERKSQFGSSRGESVPIGFASNGSLQNYRYPNDPDENIDIGAVA